MAARRIVVDPSLFYNSDGIRTGKTFTRGTQSITYDYVLDGTKIIKESVNDGISNTSYVLYYFYDESGVAGFEYNGVDYYFVKNIQGDVIEICNWNNGSVVQYTYDAWGNVLSTTGTLASTVGRYNPFRYRSYYYDTETRFYYLNSRYYDPEVCRFINADGIIGANGGVQGYNLFAYCNNNPVKYTDERGTCIHQGLGDCSSCNAAKLSGLDPDESTGAQVNCDNVATFENDEFFDDPFWASVLVDVGAELGADISSFCAKNATRPNNVGIGYFAKMQAKELQLIEYNRTVFGGVIDALFVGYDVSMGVSKNLDNNASFGKILYDATVDVALSGGSAAASYSIGAAAGTAFCPGVGTVVGLGVSFVLWLAIDHSGLRDDIKGWVE